MKKIYDYLHNPDVQGALIITCIIASIVLVSILTWGK